MIWRTFGGLSSYPLISLGEMVALGAPFFSGAGCTVGEGVNVGGGVSVGLGVGVSSGAAAPGGDTLGWGVGDAFLRFGLAFGVELGEGVGEIFFFGEAAGDGLGVDFFAVRFRCFRVGLGVGVASKTFLIFVPNDSSAASAPRTEANNVATIKNTRSSILVAGDKISARVREESLCLGECRLRDFPEENSR